MKKILLSILLIVGCEEEVEAPLSCDGDDYICISNIIYQKIQEGTCIDGSYVGTKKYYKIIEISNLNNHSEFESNTMYDTTTVGSYCSDKYSISYYSSAKKIKYFEDEKKIKYVVGTYYTIIDLDDCVRESLGTGECSVIKYTKLEDSVFNTSEYCCK